MKNFAIIGLGRFAQSMLTALMKRGSDVLVIDNDEDKVQWARDLATSVLKADATDFALLSEMLPQNVECAVVDTGREQLMPSILITNYLKKLDIPEIIVHALSPEHAEILQMVGATRSVFPEEEAAERVAGIVAGRGRLDYFPVSDQFSIVEIPPPREWVGQSLEKLQVRRKHQVNVIAVRNGSDDQSWRFPDPRAELSTNDIVLVAGKTKDVERMGR